MHPLWLLLVPAWLGTIFLLILVTNAFSELIADWVRAWTSCTRLANSARLPIGSEGCGWTETIRAGRDAVPCLLQYKRSGGLQEHHPSAESLCKKHLPLKIFLYRHIILWLIVAHIEQTDHQH